MKKQQFVKSHVVLTPADFETFRVFLKENHIKYEPSGYGQNVYVSLTVTKEQYKQIDDFLETM